MNRILVATDGSPPSAEAGVVAIELASKQRSELSFVHVVPRLDVFSAGAYTAALPHEPTERDQALLEDAAAVAAEHGIVATTALRYGVTVEEIIVFADSQNVDLIVVGSRGHGAVASALLGSVSRGVLRESKHPVLMVRAAAGDPERPRHLPAEMFHHLRQRDHALRRGHRPRSSPHGRGRDVMLRSRLIVVRDAREAETICGLLRTEGIACDHRQTDMGAGAGDAVGDSGPREILVARDHLENARQLVTIDAS